MPFEPLLPSADLSEPPVRRYGGPIIDSHTHLSDPASARRLFQVAETFGVGTVCGIVQPETMDTFCREFGGVFRPIVRIDHNLAGGPDRFGRQSVRSVREGRTKGAVAAKFWYPPHFVAETGLRLDHPTLRPVFEALAELGMAALVHVADPDCWFATQYADSARYGTKADHYEPLERVLAAFPNLKVVGAHFGGDPEHLDHLRRLLDAYPNFHIDSSATKWIARELSVKPDDSRAFLIERIDRILFGTDLVTFPEATVEHYASRYRVHRWLWEGEGMRPSPIPDPCAPWPDGPRVHGLALPDDCLARLYTGNARRLFGLDA
ncbi:MAG TPA: amidohydrolase family protein [Phycisphaerae bacterium]|nr:amidohydrolase family protein [Phycisphaerae bacterium]